jgi:hypothetical protein
MPPRSDQRKDKILACDEVCFGFAFPERGQQSTSFGETSAEDARHVHGGSLPTDIRVIASTSSFGRRIYLLPYKSKEDATWLRTGL